MTAPAATVDARSITELHRITAGGRDPITGRTTPPIYIATDTRGGLHYAPADTIQVAATTPEEVMP